MNGYLKSKLIKLQMVETWLVLR